MKKFLNWFLLGTMIFSLFFFVFEKPVKASWADYVVISEVQIAGQTANDEFIELYNPTDNPINLKDLPLKLHIRNSGGTDKNRALTFLSGREIIPARGFYLLAPRGTVFESQADATYSASDNMLVVNGGVYISISITPDIGVIDKVGFATQPESGYEINPFPTNPPTNQSIERKASQYSTAATLGHGGQEEKSGNGWDNNNNAEDFVLQTISNPQNSSPDNIENKPPLIEPPLCTPNWFCADWWPTSDAICSGEDFTQTRTCTDSNNCEREEGKPVESQQATGTKDCSVQPPGPICGNNIKEENEECDGNDLAGQSCIARGFIGGSLSCNSNCTFNTLICQAAGGGGYSPPSIEQIQSRDVVINEFVSDPVDGEEEWIELYNNTEKEIDLTEWKVEEGSGALTTISGTILAKDFFVIEKIRGYLNNSGDIIILKYGEKIIDQVTYGDWDDGNKEDNAPMTKNPNSVSRISDGYDTDQDNNDFRVSTTPTKGKSNKISNFEEKIYSNEVIINELLPNPRGDDSENEFIELKNLTDQEIDLNNWKLEDAAGTKFIITSQKLATTKISAKGFFLLWRKDSKIALNNSGIETLKLYQPNDSLVSFVQYSGTVQEDHAYARDEKNNWVWSTQVTPGQENIIFKPNQKPKAIISVLDKALLNEEITFDASDSYDPDGDSLTYFWDLGDGNQKIDAFFKYGYKKEGKHDIKLEVKDTFGVADIAKLTIEILTGEKITYLSSLEEEILVSEFLPNPKGKDEDGEWIEIYNAGRKELNLDGWFLDDIDGGSKPYKIKEKIILPGEYLVFSRQETKIALNNNFDSVRILDPEGNLFFEISYEKPKEGFSYALDENGDWLWTSILTPGTKNLFSDDEAEVKKSLVKTAIGKEAILEIPLSEIRNQDIGDFVKVQGVVSVEPGVLGVQIFYLAGSGVQIYSYKKEFPQLKVGDRIEVIGELAEYKGETRIKILSKNDILILKNEERLEPQEVKTGEIDEDLEGTLVVVRGEIIERKTNFFYLDDGSGEIKIYLKATANIKKPKMKDGDWIRVVGIVSQYGEEYRLLPRHQEDIEMIKKINNQENQNQNNFIMGSLIGDNNFSPLNLVSKVISIKYLIVSTLFLLIILIGLLVKRKK